MKTKIIATMCIMILLFSPISLAAVEYITDFKISELPPTDGKIPRGGICPIPDDVRGVDNSYLYELCETGWCADGCATDACKLGEGICRDPPETQCNRDSDCPLLSQECIKGYCKTKEFVSFKCDADTVTLAGYTDADKYCKKFGDNKICNHLFVCTDKDDPSTPDVNESQTIGCFGGEPNGQIDLGENCYTCPQEIEGGWCKRSETCKSKTLQDIADKGGWFLKGGAIGCGIGGVTGTLITGVPLTIALLATPFTAGTSLPIGVVTSAGLATVLAGAKGCAIGGGIGVAGVFTKEAWTGFASQNPQALVYDCFDDKTGEAPIWCNVDKDCEGMGEDGKDLLCRSKTHRCEKSTISDLLNPIYKAIEDAFGVEPETAKVIAMGIFILMGLVVLYIFSSGGKK
jgi:hypothetical protein